MRVVLAACAVALLAGAGSGGGATLRGSRIAFGLEQETLSSIFTVRADGTLFIADSSNDRVLKIEP